MTLVCIATAVGQIIISSCQLKLRKLERGNMFNSSLSKSSLAAETLLAPWVPLSERVTAHWCHSRDLLPDSGRRASCMFHHICVVPHPDPNNEKKHEIQWIYLTNQEKNLKDASFSLGIGPHSEEESLYFEPVGMSPSEFSIKYPGSNYVNRTSVLFYEYNAENFGHMLTDVLMPIFVALDNFDLLSENFAMIRYSMKHAIGWSCDFQRVLYPDGKVGARCDHFYEMMEQLMRSPLKVLNGTSFQPTCYETAVVGMPMYSDDCLEPSHGRKQDSWSLCNHGRQNQFWKYRAFILNKVGVSVAPPTRHKITITIRNDKKRGLSNLYELIGLVEKKYGKEMEIVSVEWDKLSIAEQFELIRTTTVHLSPPGGVSFISLFLPRWATSIRLYSMQYRLEYHIFHYLGYITV